MMEKMEIETGTGSICQFPHIRGPQYTFLIIERPTRDPNFRKPSYTSIGTFSGVA